MTKEEKIANYNPSGIGLDNGKVFGMPFNFDESELIILPIPWEVTTSFGNGTSKGPAAVLAASPQLDLYHFDYPDAWKRGYYMAAISPEIAQKNKAYKNKASEVILLQEKGRSAASLQSVIDEVNQACKELNHWVYEQTKIMLQRGKKVVLLGGDHSTPLGYLQALSQQFDSFGILQIDAHADLRQAYEGFEFSHASIFYNALKINNITSLTQVGIRDICQEEMDLIKNDDRIFTFFDEALNNEQFNGVTWQQQIEKIVETLPSKVYISFDIDGLDPKLCPNTGTPVPGGLSYFQAVGLIKAVKASGRTIIGCDLSEVGNHEWDANVGARLLYQLCSYL